MEDLLKVKAILDILLELKAGLKAIDDKYEKRSREVLAEFKAQTDKMNADFERKIFLTPAPNP